MKKLKSIGFIVLCSIHFVSWGQSIAFREADMKTASEQAKSGNKLLFVDFMADWCEPCKYLEQEVFSLPEVADYFNSRFVCVRVDVSKEENLARQYRIQAIPTLLFVDARGKELKRLEGALDASHIMYWAKVLTGDEPTMDELWSRYRKNKNEWEIARRILQEMPVYSYGMTSRTELEKWQTRVEKLFLEYWQAKPRQEWLNVTDLAIIMLYCQNPREKSDPVEFVIGHYAEFSEMVPPEVLISYLASYTKSIVRRLAMAGDLKYKAEITRLQGDLKPIFASVKTKSLPVEELITMEADALYALYGKKDQAKYLELQQVYLQKMGEAAGKEVYQEVAMNLLMAAQDKLTGDAARQALLWLDKLVTFPMKEEEKAIYVSAMGDCYVTLSDKVKAKECYNQAFLMSLQSGDAQLQAYFRKKMNDLGEE